jgi:hypothetical protein
MPTLRVPRLAARPTARREPIPPTHAPPTVLVVAARADNRGAAAAEVYAGTLRATDPANMPVIATHAGALDLAERAASAERIYVLDPGRFRAWRERRHARAGGHDQPLTAPARSADRLALLKLLRDHQSRVQWITRGA